MDIELQMVAMDDDREKETNTFYIEMHIKFKSN